MFIVKKNSLVFAFCVVFLFLSVADSQAQETKSPFWDRVNVGGGFGLNFGNGFFSGLIAPTAVYNFNQYFSAGPGLQYSYQSGNGFTSSLAGVNLIGLGNPIPEVQLSLELEQAYVTQTIEFIDGDIKDEFWNTALFVGAGYSVGRGAIGIRYNVLFNEDDNVYTTAWAPFVRVLF